MVTTCRFQAQNNTHNWPNSASESLREAITWRTGGFAAQMPGQEFRNAHLDCDPFRNSTDVSPVPPPASGPDPFATPRQRRCTFRAQRRSSQPRSLKAVVLPPPSVFAEGFANSAKCQSSCANCASPIFAPTFVRMIFPIAADGFSESSHHGAIGPVEGEIPQPMLAMRNA